jgi:serpin B
VTIRGRVVDSSDSQPVIGATVRVVGNKKSAVVTNIDGQFSIEVPDMQAEVEAIFIGFPNKRMKVQQDMLIVLDDESVVVPLRKRLRIELTDGEDSILHGINDLSFRLLRAVNEQKSTLLSPLSIACLLSMTNNGAVGQTQDEVCQLLGCQPEAANAFYKKLIPYLTGDGEGSCFSMANALFVNPKWKLKEDFRSQAVGNYQAWISNDLNVKSVNDWCSTQTRGMIPQMVDEIDPNTLLTALNAVYFESQWSDTFDANGTRLKDFTLADGTSVKLPLMHQKHLFCYGEGKDFAMLTMPYTDGCSMVVLLPDEDSSLDRLLSSIGYDDFNKVWKKSTTCRVDILLPRFETEVEQPLIPVMQLLGVRSMFDARRADYSRLAYVERGVPVYVSEMKQKARIEVSETGTKAAAVTEQSFLVGAARPPQYRNCTFHATRPFLYVIKDNFTGAILFMGTYYGE